MKTHTNLWDLISKKTHINLWDLISKKACTDEETHELQSSLGQTGRYNMQEITLESRHDFTEKETSAWVIHINSCDSSCNDNIQIVIPHDRSSPITVEEHIEVTTFKTHRASTKDNYQKLSDAPPPTHYADGA